MWIIKNGGDKVFSLVAVEIYATRNTSQKRGQEVDPWKKRGDWGPKGCYPMGAEVYIIIAIINLFTEQSF